MVQNADGGWGESCGSYDDPDTRGVGTSTPSQTAWALLGLLAAGDDRSDSIAKGVRWLLDAAAGRRQLGRVDGRRRDAAEHHHGNRLPQSLLPGLHPVPPVLPADGSHHLQPNDGICRQLAATNSTHGTRRSTALEDYPKMAIPISQMWTVATYVLKKKLTGVKRYPLVLMLEPLFRC